MLGWHNSDVLPIDFFELKGPMAQGSVLSTSNEAKTQLMQIGESNPIFHHFYLMR